MKKIEIASVLVDVPEDFDFLIEALCRCDGEILSVDLEASEFRDVMISAGYVRENSRGEIYGTDKLREEAKEIVAQYTSQFKLN